MKTSRYSNLSVCLQISSDHTSSNFVSNHCTLLLESVRMEHIQTGKSSWCGKIAISMTDIFRGGLGQLLVNDLPILAVPSQALHNSHKPSIIDHYVIL